MSQKKEVFVIPEQIEKKIYLIRGKKVMLDADLAELYDVETGQLTRQVRRNSGRFPEDFMFRLTKEEYESLRCQIGILKRGRHSKYLPYVFLEPGVAMLSSVLNSERAVQVNIQIIRTFIKLREMLAGHEDLRRKIEAMEKKYDQQFQIVFDAIKRLLEVPEKPKRRIGFHAQGGSRR